MDRFLDAYDWPQDTHWANPQPVMGQNSRTRGDSDRDFDPTLEVLKLRGGGVFAAWGIYAIMLIGLFLGDALNRTNPDDQLCLNQIGAIERTNCEIVEPSGSVEMPISERETAVRDRRTGNL